MAQPTPTDAAAAAAPYRPAQWYYKVECLGDGGRAMHLANTPGIGNEVTMRCPRAARAVTATYASGVGQPARDANGSMPWSVVRARCVRAGVSKRRVQEGARLGREPHRNRPRDRRRAPTRSETRPYPERDAPAPAANTSNSTVTSCSAAPGAICTNHRTREGRVAHPCAASIARRRGRCRACHPSAYSSSPELIRPLGPFRPNDPNTDIAM